MSDTGFFVLLAVAGAVGLLTLAAGEATALVAHHQVLPRPGGAMTAALAQWIHLGHPQLAWPVADRAWVQPVGLYWSAFGLAAAVLVGLVFWVGTMWSRRPAALGGTALGVERQARLATAADLGRLMVPGVTTGRIILGRWHTRSGPLLATEDETGPAKGWLSRAVVTSGRPSVIVLGPARSGKTFGLAVPAVAEWSGPALVVSVKGDILDATLSVRSCAGEVQVFDPRHVTRHRSGRWSPIARASTLSEAIRVARGLGEASPYGAKSDGEFWRATAEDVLGPLLYCAHLGGRSMRQLFRWVLAGADEDAEGWRDEVEEILSGSWATPAEHMDAESALAQLAASWKLGGQMHSSVWLMSRVTLRPWADPQIAASAESPTIDAGWLLSGDNTLYVAAPARQQAEVAPVFAGVVSTLLDAAAETAQAEGGQLRRRLLVVLDEAANTAPLRDLATYASTAGGQGIQLITIYQDLAQIRTRYQDAAATIVNNHLAKVVLPGVSDAETLKLVSDLAGEEEYDRRSQSRNLGDGGGSVSTGAATRRLLPMDLLRRMPVGSALLLYGQLPPAHLVLRLSLAQRLRTRLSAPAVRLWRRLRGDAATNEETGGG